MKQLLTSANLIRLLAGWAVLSSAFLLGIAMFFMPPNARAVILMATGLMICWVILGGGIIWCSREQVHTVVQRIPIPWPIKFVVFCTLLALAEEAITVIMTNLAPVFGVPLGAAYITASANYLDVVALHSVVVFIPMFIAWAWMFTRWDVSPNIAFLLFGLTGFLVEGIFSGAPNFIQLGFWIFVYGLMIYLPTYCLPPREGLRPLRWWHYPILLLFPVLFAIPVAAVVSTLHPIPIHFPPILSDS